MERKASDELLSLFRDAIKVGGAALEMRVRRFASFVRSSDPELAQSVAVLVANDPTRAFGSATTMRTSPVDSDTKLPLVRMEAVGTPRVEPLLSPTIKAEVDRVVRERAAADRLMAAGLMPVRSVLLSGPPGLGKTMTAGWLATKLQLPLFTLDLASVMSSYLGKTGANVRAALNHAQDTPCVLLLDEFDAIAKRRDDDSDVGELKRLVTVILQTIDDWSPQSLLVAATNHGELLDPAVWRRFDATLTFTLPTQEQRAQLLVSHGVNAELADAISAVIEGQNFSGIARAIEIAQKQVILEGTPLEETLIDWALIQCPEVGRSSAAIARQRRDLQALLFHGRNLSAREIADHIGTSHTTVIRSLKRFQGRTNAGT